MKNNAFTKLAPAIAVLTLTAAVAHATAPRDVDDLVGVRASNGETKLHNRGYRYRKTIQVFDNSISYWWNRDRQACIAVTTENGRYKSIMSQPDAVCDKDAMDAHANYGGTYSGTQDLVGKRASNGEQVLTERGYRMVNSSRGSDRIWSNWWNQAHRKCITVMTRNGRYEAITETLPADCDRGHGSTAGHGGPTPQIRTVDGGNVAVDVGGCNVLFHPNGGIVNQGRSCSDHDVRQAKDAFHGYRREQGAYAGSEAPPGGFSAPGSGSTITCESRNNQYQFCRHPIGSHAQVRIARRLSSDGCVQGQSWGHEAEGVWVNHGCRAVFEIR